MSMDSEALATIFAETLEGLGERERLVVQLRLGLSPEGVRHTWKEIGLRVGCTGPRARGLYLNGMATIAERAFSVYVRPPAERGEQPWWDYCDAGYFFSVRARNMIAKHAPDRAAFLRLNREDMLSFPGVGPTVADEWLEVQACMNEVDAP